MWKPGIVLLLAGLAAAAPGIESIDRIYARRMVSVARKAERAKQGATAATIYARVVELDPGNTTARMKLGYRRVDNTWELPRGASPAKTLRADTDHARAAEFRKQRHDLELQRADAILEAELKDHYLATLAYAPRHEGLHRALGHQWINGRPVRPELAAAARMLVELETEWRDLARKAVSAKSSGRMRIPGLPGDFRRYRAGSIEVAGTLPRDEMKDVVRSLPLAGSFLRRVFGADHEPWSATPLYFLPADAYGKMIDSLVPDGPERALRKRGGTYFLQKGVAFWTNTGAFARDVYAHAVCFWSVQNWVTQGTSKREIARHAWFKEGVSYLATFALLDSGNSWFVSWDESSQKLSALTPLPEWRDNDNCHRWVCAQMRDGTAYRLREVVGRTLNSLDPLASLQAWSFLRFLAAYRPMGLRRLPAALRAQTEGGNADRADRALKECFGKGLAELEPLWRAFVLEVA